MRQESHALNRVRPGCRTEQESCKELKKINAKKIQMKRYTSKVILLLISINFFQQALQARNLLCDLAIAAVNVQHPSDCGTNDGAVEIISTGMNSFNLEYTVDGGVSWVSGNYFSNLPAGAYGVGVRYVDSSCPFFHPVPIELIGPDSPRFIEVETADPTDCGLENGFISIYAEGGTGPYSYSIDGGLNWNASNQFQNLPPGTYAPMVKNADGTCPTAYVLPVVLNAMVVPHIDNVSSQQPTDCDLADGVIIIDAEGEGSMLYSVDNGESWQDSGYFSGLPDGTYKIAIKNADNTCLIEGETIFLAGPVRPQILSTQAVNPTDCLETNGQIEILAIGQTSDPKYSIDGGLTWQITGLFDNLGAGTFDVQIKNADETCGTVDGGAITLTDPPQPEITLVESLHPSDCSLSDGSIQILAYGGFGELEFSIDNGQTWGTNPNFESLSHGQYFPGVRNQDGTCLKQTDPIFLNEPPKPEVEFVYIQSPSDCGATDGAIQVLVSGGIGNYEFSIEENLWQDSDWFFDLAADDYNVLVRNADSTCLSEFPIQATITEPEAPEIIDIQYHFPVHCEASNGSIKIITASGSSLVEYSIDNGETWQYSNTFEGLGYGQYSILVKTTNSNCIGQGETLVFEDPGIPIVEELFWVDPTACGVHDGQIYILIQEGNYEFSINGGLSWQQEGIYQNLSSGNYQLLVRSGQNGCLTDLGSIELAAPQQVNIDHIELINPSFCSSNGQIIIFPENNSQELQFSIDAGNEWQESPEFQALLPGEYPIHIRTMDGTCEAFIDTVELYVTSLDDFVEVVSLQPTGCESNDGQIILNFTPLENSFLVSINNGETWEAQYEFDDLPVGSYDVWLNFPFGECEEFLATVELISPEAPSVEELFATFSLDCEESFANVEFLMSGEGELKFSIDGGLSWQWSPFFDSLGPGTYLPAVWDTTSNCSVELDPILVPFPFSHMDIGITGIDPTDCGLDNGKIEIIAAGPNGPYEYSLDGQVWQSIPFFSNLSSGSYHVFLKDENGDCEIMAGSITLESPENPEVIQVSASQLSHCNGNDGWINIVATGGIGVYQYSIDGGQNWQQSSDFFGLSAGEYSVAVRNANGTCVQQFQNQVVIQSPELPTVDEVLVTDVTDCNLMDGQITLLGTFSGEQFSIDNGVYWSDSNFFDGLSTGTYSVLIRNQQTLCEVNLGEYFINAPQLPQIDSIITSPVSDCWSEDGSLLVIPFLEDADYQYSIDNGLSWQNSSLFNNLPTGELKLRIRNTDGTCNYIQRSVEIEGYFAPQILDVERQNPNNCTGDNGQIFISTDNAESYEYSIDGGTTWSFSPGFDELQPGYYSIKVRISETSCELTYPQLVMLESMEPISLDTLELLPPACFGGTDGALSINGQGGLPPYAFFWSIGDVGPEINDIGAGTYAVTILDARGCSEMFKIKMEQPEPLEIDLGEGLDTTICLGQSVSYHFFLEGAAFQWQSDQGFESDSSSVVIAEEGKYWVTIENEFGCTVADTINIKYRDAFFDADFLLPQEGVINHPIVLIDISWPVPDSISWFYVQEEVEVQQTTDDKLTVVIPETGIYHFGMRAYSGECYGILEKEILLVSSSEELMQEIQTEQSSSVLEFKILPNPNQGVFKVTAILNQAQVLQFWVIDPTGNPIDHRLSDTGIFHLEEFDLNLAPGVYTVALETAGEWKYLNFVISN